MLFLMICWISVVYLFGCFRCGGNGMLVLRELCIFWGMLVIIGVLKMFGVMVIIWMLKCVSLWVMGRVMLIILFFEVE